MDKLKEKNTFCVRKTITFLSYTSVNRAVLSFYGGCLEITLTVPLNVSRDWKKQAGPDMDTGLLILYRVTQKG